MDNQDSENSPTVIPCSEEMFSKPDGSDSVQMPPPVVDRSNQLLEEPSQEMSESLLASQNNVTMTETPTGRPSDLPSVNNSNSTMDLEGSVSEINPMSSTRIDPENSMINPMSSTRIDVENSENSISMMNEGFVIDSASLSLSAVNDTVEMSEKNVIPDYEDEEMNDATGGDDLEESTLEKDQDKGAGDDSMDEDEDSAEYPLPQFPLSRVKKIMTICAATTEEEEESPVKTKKGKKETKGKGNIMITKEAIYLTTLATEHFVSVVGRLAGDITLASKKKTLTMEHLKQALGDSDAFAFLEGCFHQPHLI